MRNRLNALGLGLLLAAAAFVPAAALAQPGAPPAPYPECKGRTVSSSDSEKAHTIYLAGKVKYDESDYAAAIAQFREAYSRDCTKHELLIIISAAYAKDGNKVEAVRALRTYLERVPNTPDRSTYERSIENLEKQIAAQPPASAQPSASATSPPPAATPPAAPAQERGHTIYPWLVVGAGGAAMVAGGLVHALRPALPENCEASTGKCKQKPGESDSAFEDDQARAGRWKTMPKIGTALLVGGGVLVVGGIVWHFLEPTGPKEASVVPKLRPEVAPGFAGASVGGSF
jgi:tetratricopeptide (TPR) repeat protein